MARRWWSTIVLARIRPSHPRTVRTSRRSDARSSARTEKRCNTSSASSRLPKRRRRKASKSCRDSTTARRTAAFVNLAAADPSCSPPRSSSSSSAPVVMAWPASLEVIDAVSRHPLLLRPGLFFCLSLATVLQRITPGLMQIKRRIRPFCPDCREPKFIAAIPRLGATPQNSFFNVGVASKQKSKLWKKPRRSAANHAWSLKTARTCRAENGKWRRPARSRRPLIVSTLAYFRLDIAVRSNLPATTKAEPHQLEPNPPGLIGVTAFVNRAF